MHLIHLTLIWRHLTLMLLCKQQNRVSLTSCNTPWHHLVLICIAQGLFTYQYVCENNFGYECFQIVAFCWTRYSKRKHNNQVKINSKVQITEINGKKRLFLSWPCLAPQVFGWVPSSLASVLRSPLTIQENQTFVWCYRHKLTLCYYVNAAGWSGPHEKSYQA